VAAVGQGEMVKWRQTILPTSLLSNSPTGWSTAGVAHSNHKQSLLKSVVSVPYKLSEWVFIKLIRFLYSILLSICFACLYLIS